MDTHPMSQLSSSSAIIPWPNLLESWQNKIKSSLITDKNPDYLIYPENELALSEIVTFASNNKQKIIICGNGTKLDWGGLVTQADLVISTRNLDRIIEHAVDDLTLTVEAGVTLKQIQKILKPFNQFLPLDPSYPETATIGGIVATADSGSLRQRYGGVRDLILGLSFVRADGAIAKAGGRVVKNVAGYDLMKLFTGSYGTLGIISQVTLRLYPLPPVSATITLTGDAEAIEKARQILVNSALTPTAADIISSSLINQLNLGEGMGLIIRFQSIGESVQEQIKITTKLGQELGLEIAHYHDINEHNLWLKLNNLNSSIIAKAGILPTESVTMLNETKSLGIINVSSGLGKLYLDNLEQVKKNRLYCEQNQGFLTILSSSKEIKNNLEPWGYFGNYSEIISNLKKQFDPNNIFNWGRFS